MSYFNEDQEAHMAYLATVPRDQRCGSGWHVVASESCNCGPYQPCAVPKCQRSRHHTSESFCYEDLQLTLSESGSRCGNCGVWRRLVDDYFIEKCPNCGDDETFLFMHEDDEFLRETDEIS